MREQKFLAGLGTILVFGGIYCFKALLQKPLGHSPDIKKSTKVLLFLAGCVLVGLGVWILVKSFMSIINN